MTHEDLTLINLVCINMLIHVSTLFYLLILISTVKTSKCHNNALSRSTFIFLFEVHSTLNFYLKGYEL